QAPKSPPPPQPYACPRCHHRRPACCTGLCDSSQRGCAIPDSISEHSHRGGGGLQQGFATWRCYHGRGCGTASPRLTSSTTLLGLRASYWGEQRGTTHAALSCNAACIFRSICTAAVRFRPRRYQGSKTARRLHA
ncbi:hypothetical protein T440DRAFT_122960, partial [Plenodomus tracheiphilus IPT5]